MSQITYVVAQPGLRLRFWIEVGEYLILVVKFEASWLVDSESGAASVSRGCSGNQRRGTEGT